MAFRRRRNFRHRRFSKPLARKRFQWVNSWISQCCWQEIPCYQPEGWVCGMNAGKLELMGQSELQVALSSDNIGISRILGDLWLLPHIDYSGFSGGSCSLTAFEYLAGLTISARVSIFKSQTSNVVPNGIDYDFYNNNQTLDPIRYDAWEWVEHEPWKTWQHLWTPGVDVGIHSDTYGNTTSGSYTWELSDGTGGPFTQPATSTAAAQANNVPGPCVSHTPRAWHLHLDMKPKRRLKENESLFLEIHPAVIGYPDSDLNCTPIPCGEENPYRGMFFYGAIKSGIVIG